MVIRDESHPQPLVYQRNSHLHSPFFYMGIATRTHGIINTEIQESHCQNLRVHTSFLTALDEYEYGEWFYIRINFLTRIRIGLDFLQVLGFNQRS